MTSCLKSWSYRFIHRKCICQRTISNYYNSSSIPSSDQGWKRGNVLSRLHNLSCPWIYRSYSLSSTLLIFKRRSTSLFVKFVKFVFIDYQSVLEVDKYKDAFIIMHFLIDLIFFFEFLWFLSIYVFLNQFSYIIYAKHIFNFN